MNITYDVEERRDCLKRRLCGHGGKKIDLKRKTVEEMGERRKGVEWSDQVGVTMT